MLTIVQAPGYGENVRRSKGAVAPCVVCGRGVARPRYLVHVHEGGAAVVTEAEAEALNRAGRAGADCGGYPIGADCLRAHPEYRPYVTRA